MDLNLIKELRKDPNILKDYYLDHALDIREEFNKLKLNIKPLTSSVMGIFVYDLQELADNIDKLKVFPIQHVYINEDPLLPSDMNKYTWWKNKGPAYVPNIFFSKLKSFGVYYKCYETITDAKLALEEAILEVLYE